MTCFHSTQARRLIRLCSGPKVAADLCGISQALMSNYQSETVKAFMPAHIIERLEREAGAAVYSAALVNLVDPCPSRSMLEDAMGAARVAGSLPQQVHEALADGRIDELERRGLSAAADELRIIADAIQAALSDPKMTLQRAG